MALVRALRVISGLVASAWEYFQVELHGKYSVERLYNLNAFGERTTTLHAVLALVFTPVPCLAVVIGTELIPLQPPEDGLDASATFWLRVFLTTWMMNFTVLEQCRFLIPQFPMRLKENVLVSLFSSSGATAIVLGLSNAIGYPLPFLIALGSPGCCALICIAGALVWGKHIRGNPATQAELKNYVLVASAQLTMTYVYPAYNFVFVSLRGPSQTAFALLLPVIKIVAKNALNYLFHSMEDFKPEMVIFNVEIFHALFVSYCMQNASSIQSALVLMVTDFVQACLSLYDIERALQVIHKVIAETQLAVTAKNNVVRVHATTLGGDKKKRIVARDWCTLDMVVHIIRSDKKLQNDHSNFRFESQVVWPAMYAVHQLTNAVQRVSRTSRRSVAPTSSTTDLLRADGESGKNTALPGPPSPLDDRKRSHFVTLFSSSDSDKPDEDEQEFIDAMTESNKMLFAQKMLQLLYLTEFLLLIEFTEVIIPVVYCKLLAVTLLRTILLNAMVH